jgi:hypothetical protein
VRAQALRQAQEPPTLNAIPRPDLKVLLRLIDAIIASLCKQLTGLAGPV